MLPISKLLLAGFAAAALLSASAAAQSRDIGTAVEIRNQVTATEQNAASRQLARRDPIRELEVLETARNANGEFILADDTKLALGPNARLALDKFVYDPNRGSGGQVTVNFVKGAFRFITGNSSKEAYEIKTPTVSLGVRGTVIDGFVADNNAMAVLVHDGGVNACTTRCVLQNKKAEILYITPQGLFIRRSRWDPDLLPGVSIQTAFPFLERRLTIDPTIHLRYADLLSRGPFLKKAELPSPPSPPAPPPEPPIGPLAVTLGVIAAPILIMELSPVSP